MGKVGFEGTFDRLSAGLSPRFFALAMDINLGFESLSPQIDYLGG
jgi:hypothetical protein